MKEFCKALFATAVVLGLACGALVLLRSYAGRSYLTVEED